MTARRPPSLRDPENYISRLRVNSRGNDIGRLLSGAPATELTTLETPDVDNDTVTEPGLAFKKDRFPSSGTLGSAPSTLALSYPPLTDSLHLYKNKTTVLDEGTDYSLSGSTVTILASSVTTGDFVTARYAWTGVESVVTFSDDFTGTNGDPLTGRGWDVVLGTGSIQSNTMFATASNSITVLKDIGSPDVDITFVFAQGGTQTAVGAHIRQDAANTSYVDIDVRRGELRTNISGGVTVIATFTGASAGDTYRAVVSGSTYTLYRNGGLLSPLTGTFSSAALNTETRHGVSAASSAFSDAAIDSVSIA